MRSSRRTLALVVLLAVAVALVVILQRRGGDLAIAEDKEVTPRSIDEARTTDRVVPAAASAASTAIPGDAAVAQCAQTIGEAADFATSERNAASPGQPSEPREDDQLLAELGNAQRALAGSRDPEHYLAALLLDPPGRRAALDAAAQTKLIELADRAIRSGSKLLAWHALSACAAAKQSCPIAHLEQRLLEVDKQNADAWALVAMLRHGRGDAGGALAAMQGAARAPASTWYWTETIALIERSLAAETPISYPDRLATAFGTAAATMPSLGYQMCKAESASSRAWGEACLAFGNVQAERNETDAARSMAHSIREQALIALGDRERAAEVAAELAHVRAQRYGMAEEPASSMIRLQLELITTDPARLHAFLGAIQRFGEVAGARMFLRQEVPPLLERAGLLERDGAPECVARFFVATRRATAEQRAQVADELHVSLRSRSGGGQRLVRVRPDGRITLPFVRGTRTAEGKVVRAERELEAAGKTTGQLQREIATMLSEYHPSPEILLTLLSPGSPQELRVEYANAQKEAAARRSISR